MLILAIIPLPAGLSSLSTHEQSKSKTTGSCGKYSYCFQSRDVHVPLIHSAGARLVTHRRTVQVLQIDGTQPEVPE